MMKKMIQNILISLDNILVDLLIDTTLLVCRGFSSTFGGHALIFMARACSFTFMKFKGPREEFGGLKKRRNSSEALCYHGNAYDKIKIFFCIMFLEAL